ncbi:MAG: DUF4129 domain-containing protein [Thermoanaerobaculia bacterium]
MTRRDPSDRQRRPGSPGAGSADRDLLGGLPLLEEAFHLLRRAPVMLFVTFYAGSVPFVLYLLFFIADHVESRAPGVGAALVAGLLYCVMKLAQARFAGGLRARLGPAEGVASPFQHALVQLESQPGSLFVLPAALLVGLPFGWAYAYYQSLAVTGDRRAARRHARVWPRQNHSLLALLALCSILVFANALAMLVVLPALLHALLGLQSAATTHPMGMLSSTTATVAAALTYLAMAPLSRAAYALRCFYRDARTSGDDLRGEIRVARGIAFDADLKTGLTAGLALVAALLGSGPAVARVPGDLAPSALLAPVSAELPAPDLAPGPTPDEAGPSPRARQLDDAIDQVLERREFAWRLPRAQGEESAGFFAGLTRPILEATRRWVSWTADRVSALFEWLRERLRIREPHPTRSPGGFGGIGWTGLLFALVALLGFAGTILLLRRRRRRPEESKEQAERAIDPAFAALLADDVAAAALPSDQWMAAARDLLSRGDARGAVRAAYLATLAFLANERLVTPSRFKSNRDYQRELARRARDRPGVADLFAEGVAAFERVWYGTHDATTELAVWSMAQVGRLQSRVR